MAAPAWSDESPFDIPGLVCRCADGLHFTPERAPLDDLAAPDMTLVTSPRGVYN